MVCATLNLKLWHPYGLRTAGSRASGWVRRPVVLVGGCSGSGPGLADRMTAVSFMLARGTWKVIGLIEEWLSTWFSSYWDVVHPRVGHG